MEQRPVKRARSRDIVVVSAALMERRERSRSAAIGAPPPCEHACSPGVHPCCSAWAAEQRRGQSCQLAVISPLLPVSLAPIRRCFFCVFFFSQELTRRGSDARGEAGRCSASLRPPHSALLFPPGRRSMNKVSEVRHRRS